MTYRSLPTAASLDEARARLTEVEHILLLGPDGAPSALLTADLVDRAAWPPLLTIPAGMSAAEFAASTAVTLLDLSDDIVGVVAVDDGRPVGVLPIAAVDDALTAEATHPHPTTMGPYGPTGDGALAGDVALPKALVRCHWPGCGFVNQLLFYDRSAPPPCANPSSAAHTLVIAPGRA
ncbi:hypothetical protein ABZW49_13205 [Nonomuraea wenchangensis]